MRTRECGKAAIAIYVWPTMQQLPVCEEHATRMRGVASAMGFSIGSLPIPYPDDPSYATTCTQQVSAS